MAEGSSTQEFMTADQILRLEALKATDWDADSDGRVQQAEKFYQFLTKENI